MERINLYEYRRELIEALTELVNKCGGTIELFEQEDIDNESALSEDAIEELPSVAVSDDCTFSGNEYLRNISVYGLTTNGSNWRDGLWIVWYEDGYVCDDNINLEAIDSVVGLESIDYLFELVENKIKDSVK